MESHVIGNHPTFYTLFTVSVTGRRLPWGPMVVQGMVLKMGTVLTLEHVPGSPGRRAFILLSNLDGKGVEETGIDCDDSC